MASTDFVHSRLRIPRDDEAVVEWLRNQHNISTSLRLLIRADISAHGTTDILSRPPVGWGDTAHSTTERLQSVSAEVESSPPARHAQPQPAEPEVSTRDSGVELVDATTEVPYNPDHIIGMLEHNR